MSHLPKGLHKRDDVYAYRYVVPKEERQYTSHRLIIKSLFTTDLEEALECLPETVAKIRRDVNRSIQERQGSLYPTIQDALDVWLEAADGITRSTKNAYRAAVEGFIAHVGNIRTHEITREIARDYYEHLNTVRSAKTKKPLAAKTIRSKLTVLSSFWSEQEYLERTGEVENNPFLGLMRHRAGRKRVTQKGSKDYRAISRDEALDLLGEVERAISSGEMRKYTFEAPRFLKLLWSSAARPDEIASLETKNINDCGEYITIDIEDGKTENARRRLVFTSPSDLQVIRECLEASREAEDVNREEGYLFPALPRGGSDKKKSVALLKSLARRKASYNDDETWTVYSFRRSGMAAAINAEVPVETRNRMVGHSNESLAAGVYARNADWTPTLKTGFENMVEALGGPLETGENTQ